VAKVFVYGTLKKDFPLYHYMQGSKFLESKEVKGLQMYDYGSFPIVWPGNGVVHGELYEVSEETLAVLDRIEGHPRFYERVLVNKDFYVYIKKPDPDYDVLIESGIWETPEYEDVY